VRRGALLEPGAARGHDEEQQHEERNDGPMHVQRYLSPGGERMRVELVRLHRIFEIYPTKAEAVLAFHPKPAGVS